MKGRLNIFQATMLRWRELHPYNAVHVVRVDTLLDAVRLTHDIDATFAARGLTGFVVDAHHHASRIGDTLPPIGKIHGGREAKALP